MEDTAQPPAGPEPAQEHSRGNWWTRTPLYLRILGGLALGVLVGLFAGEGAGVLELPSRLILRMLGALAPPLILVAVMHALITANLRGRVAGRLAGLLVLNTVVAIVIGLLVANVVRPGRHAHLTPHGEPSARAAGPKDALTQFLDNVPDSLFRPLVDSDKVLGVILIAVAFGIALRPQRRRRIQDVEDLLRAAFDALLAVLHWVVQMVPFGVFGIVASIIGRSGFRPFVGLGAFIIAVLLGLALQATYYMVRVKLGSWVSPLRLLKGTRDALVMAFSTASSTATMPVTYECLRTRVGLREESASMGALVGSNFNNDGTALYEAMSALFIAQMLGQNLPLSSQVAVVGTSVVASVGAAGIPEAGLVTMTLVFKAVGLPAEYIALLITVDWFLDRCRTAINVMGDMNVSCLLDGKMPAEPQTGVVNPGE